jgi:hypothetical protein
MKFVGKKMDRILDFFFCSNNIQEKKVPSTSMPLAHPVFSFAETSRMDLEFVALLPMVYKEALKCTAYAI